MKTYVHSWSYLAQFFSEWETFQTKIVQKIKIHILCSINYFFLKNRAFYEIMLKNFIEWGRPQMTIWRMHNACWITKAKHTDPEYVTLTAFPLQQWLEERASVLRHTYIASLSEYSCTWSSSISVAFISCFFCKINSKPNLFPSSF
jgi:hypothetical protein